MPLLSMLTLQVTYENTLSGHHSLGYQMGIHCRAMYAEALPLDRPLQALLGKLSDPVFLTEVRQFEAYLVQTCPLIHAEMCGLAEGAQVDFTAVLLSVYRKELGCSDVLVSSPDFTGWGHNEDYSWSTHFRPLLLLEAIRQPQGCALNEGERGREFRWLSILYPFCLGGMTIGANSHGVVFSVDNLTPVVEGSPVGLASNVVCRLALEARDLAEFLTIVTDPRLVTGRGFAYGDWRTGMQMGYVETGPRGVHAHKLHITGKYGHANHYIEMSIPQEIGSSSTRRQDRLNEWMKGGTLGMQDVLSILSDEEFADYPIYRTGKSPDKGYTQFSAVVDLKHKRLLIYLDKPVTGVVWKTLDLTHTDWV